MISKEDRDRVFGLRKIGEPEAGTTGAQTEPRPLSCLEINHRHTADTDCRPDPADRPLPRANI